MLIRYLWEFSKNFNHTKILPFPHFIMLMGIKSSNGHQQIKTIRFLYSYQNFQRIIMHFSDQNFKTRILMQFPTVIHIYLWIFIYFLSLITAKTIQRNVEVDIGNNRIEPTNSFCTGSRGQPLTFLFLVHTSPGNYYIFIHFISASICHLELLLGYLSPIHTAHCYFRIF